MSDPIAAFEIERAERVRQNAENAPLRAAANRFVGTSIAARYSYNFQCLGRPVIQYPQDIVAIQELVWTVRPDLILETGIAHGGSLMLSASMLALLDYCDAAGSGAALDVPASTRRVIGVDIEIRPHNRYAIERHPLAHKIDMIEGSSVAPEIVAEVYRRAADHQRVMVLLDSNHTHDHVLAELRAYAPLVSRRSYCVVFDTVIEKLPANAYPDRAWGPGNNPGTAISAFLAEIAGAKTVSLDGHLLRLEVDHELDSRLLVSAASGGYLRRI